MRRVLHLRVFTRQLPNGMRPYSSAQVMMFPLWLKHPCEQCVPIAGCLMLNPRLLMVLHNELRLNEQRGKTGSVVTVPST